MPSDIHVLVRFKEQCVFAGEELNCTITFRNVADIPEPSTPGFGPPRGSRQESIGQLAAQIPRNGFPTRGFPTSRIVGSVEQRLDSSTHQRHTAPSTPPSASTSGPPAAQLDSIQPGKRPAHKHQRSISIISVTSPSLSTKSDDPTVSNSNKPGRPGHRRSSTVQLYTGAQTRPVQYHREPSLGLQIPNRNGRRSPLSASTHSVSPSSGSHHSTPEYQFPPEPTQPITRGRSPAERVISANHRRVVSAASHVASERSSAEFYSMSNHSEETIMSEQPSIMSERPLIPSALMRQHYRMDPKPPRKPQAANLLMGYAQLNATFTLDGSLVDQSQFEDVKKKGFLGGQAGGGVVGVKNTRPSSGFLGNFNLNSIGESLSNLVNSDNMSSVKEMNAVTSSRAVPLLSTPQSLLFVDLHLEPGEEKSFSFAYVLPQGLPSSYRGKTIRIVYNLTVGVQGVPGNRDVHTVRQVNIPIRVFSGVNADAEVYGHDLMQPHVILQDLAHIKPLDRPDVYEQSPHAAKVSNKSSPKDFLRYVDTLLDRSRRRLSSTGTIDAHFISGDTSETRLAIQAINRAIQLSNQISAQARSSPNRFEISRNGLRVAVIMLDRPLHRLGETITAVVDFSEKQIPCASVRMTLETVEKVSSSLAVRSTASITRVTRKVYGASFENVLFAKRTIFTPNIPATASPTFITSGVNLDWSIRIEFGTIKSIEDEEGQLNHQADLLEDIIDDERGITSVAVESLECETFEVIIPITVYGDIIPSGKEEEDIIGIPL